MIFPISDHVSFFENKILSLNCVRVHVSFHVQLFNAPQDKVYQVGCLEDATKLQMQKRYMSCNNIHVSSHAQLSNKEMILLGMTCGLK